MFYTIAESMTNYFTGFGVETKRINDLIYITVKDFVEYIVRIESDVATILEMDLNIAGRHNVYHDIKMGNDMDSSYAMHAIFNSLIVSRDILNIKYIVSDNIYFRQYIRRAYPNYELKQIVTINDIISIESEKFGYMSLDSHLGTSKIRINVPYYPIGIIVKNPHLFATSALVIDFKPYVQNARVIVKACHSNLSEFNQILIELMYKANLSDLSIAKIIDKYFDGKVNDEMIANIRLFKFFNRGVIKRYGLMENGKYEVISKMYCIEESFIYDNYKLFEPYIVNILKDPYCSIEFIKKHRRQVRINKLWSYILTFNKTLTREFIIENVRHSPNVLVHRFELLEPGDEYLFRRYRKHIDWKGFSIKFKGTNLDISQIIHDAGKYLKASDAVLIITKQFKYTHNTTK